MLLDAETLDLAPARAPRSIEALGGDPRFKLEMPAAQLEIVTAPHADRRRRRGRARAGPRRARARRARRFRVAGAGAHPFASGLGPLNPGRALRGDRRRVRERRPPPARLRPARARRDPRRRPRARRLQRAPLAPARARRAGRQRAVLRGPRQRAGVGPLADQRAAPAPGRPARARELRGVRRGAALVRLRRPAPVVVGAAPAPAVRHGRGPRAGHAGDGRRHRRGRRGRARARHAPRRRATTPASAAGRRVVADRPEPLGGVPPRARRA